MKQLKYILYLFFLMLIFNITYAGRMYDCWVARWTTPDPLMQKYPSLSPYNYVANNPIINIDPDGREIRNSGGYVVQNPRLVQSLVQFNDAIVKITGKQTSEFVMDVTGGDRYRTIVSGSAANPANSFDMMVDISRTNTKPVWNSDINSPHLEKFGARGIDLSIPDGITKEQIIVAAVLTGFKRNQVRFYSDGHFHLTLAQNIDATGKVILDKLDKGNKPTFEETRQSSSQQQESPFYSAEADATAVSSGFKGWATDDHSVWQDTNGDFHLR